MCMLSVLKLGKERTKREMKLKQNGKQRREKYDEIGEVIMEGNDERRSEIERESVPEWSKLLEFRMNAVQETI